MVEAPRQGSLKLLDVDLCLIFTLDCLRAFAHIDHFGRRLLEIVFTFLHSSKRCFLYPYGCYKRLYFVTRLHFKSWIVIRPMERASASLILTNRKNLGSFVGILVLCVYLVGP